MDQIVTECERPLKAGRPRCTSLNTGVWTGSLSSDHRP
jgi:hypothetical protein